MHQGLVADFVPPPIIDFFEEIDIEHDQGCRLAAPLGTFHFLPESLGKIPIVGKTRQGVGAD